MPQQNEKVGLCYFREVHMGVPFPNTETKILWNTAMVSSQPALRRQVADHGRFAHYWHQDCTATPSIALPSPPTGVQSKSPRYQTSAVEELKLKYQFPRCDTVCVPYIEPCLWCYKAILMHSSALS